MKEMEAFLPIAIFSKLGQLFQDFHLIGPPLEVCIFFLFKQVE